MNQPLSSYTSQVFPPAQKKLRYYSTKRLIVSLQGCDTQFRKSLSKDAKLDLEHPALFNHWNLFIHEALGFMFDKYQPNPIDWSLRLLGSVEDQMSLHDQLLLAENKSPIVFCPAIKQAARVIHEQPTVLTGFFFSVIEAFRQVGLPSQENDWLFYDSYFEGSVIVSVSKENKSWTQ